MNQNETTKANGWALIPIFVFLIIFLGSGFVTGDFYSMPAIVAFLIALTVAFVQNRGLSFNEKFKIVSRGVGDENIITMCLIYLAAGAFSGAVQAAGGVESTVNLGLSVLPSGVAVAGIFIIGCFISVSMGTSMGTIAALAPIAVGISEKAGFPLPMCIGSVVCGAMFGDNLAFISDTTIAATKGAGCEIKDKFKMNFKIALPAAIFAAVMYTIFGSGTNVDVAGTAQIEIIKIFPYLAVLIMAFCGMDVIYVLGIGILASAVIGFMTGSLDFFSLCANMQSGIGGMYSICLMALVLKGIVGRIQTMGGIDWIVSKAAGNVKTRKGAQYFLAAFTSIIDVCIGNNTICIIIGADVLKPIMKKFKIAPQRFASLLDIFACIIPGISPLGINVMAAMAYAETTNPFAMMKYAFYLYALAALALLAVHFFLF